MVLIKHHLTRLWLYVLTLFKAVYGLENKGSLSIVVETTTRCNRRCLYCPRHIIPSVRDLGDIKPEIVELMVKRLGEFKIEDHPQYEGLKAELEPLITRITKITGKATPKYKHFKSMFRQWRPRYLNSLVTARSLQFLGVFGC